MHKKIKYIFWGAFALAMLFSVAYVGRSYALTMVHSPSAQYMESFYYQMLIDAELTGETTMHIHDWIEVKLPTCDTTGTKKCETCGEVAVMDALQHQYWEWGQVVEEEDKEKFYHVDKAPTCISDGEKSFHCIRCGYRYEITVLAKIGHDYVETVTKEPTCTQEGEVEYTCKNDATHTYTEKIEKLPHKESEWIEESKATYFAEGKKYKTCSECSQRTAEEVIPKLKDEDFPTGSISAGEIAKDKFSAVIPVELFTNNAVEIQITGSDKGSGLDEIYYYISKRTMSITELDGVKNWIKGTSVKVNLQGNYVVYARLTDKVGNVAYLSSAGFVIDKENPSVTGIIDKSTYCMSVSFTVDEEVTVTVNKKRLVKNAQGYYIISSTGDNAISIKDKAGNSVALNVKINKAHTPGKFKPEPENTCTTDGKNVQKCTICHDVLKTEILKATGHDGGKWETVKDVTCTQDGLRERKCTKCNAVVESVEDKSQGHVESQWTTQKETTCTRDGSEIRYCLTCNQVTSERTVEAEGHILGDWIETKPATCTESGRLEKLCNVCHECIRFDDIDAKGHSPSEWKYVTEPTCTEQGRYVQRCAGCDDILDEQLVDAKGHQNSYGKCTVCGKSAGTRSLVIVAVMLFMLLFCIVTVVTDMRLRRGSRKNRL